MCNVRLVGSTHAHFWAATLLLFDVAKYKATVQRKARARIYAHRGGGTRAQPGGGAAAQPGGGAHSYIELRARSPKLAHRFLHQSNVGF